MCILRILCSRQLYLQLIAGHLRDKSHPGKNLLLTHPFCAERHTWNESYRPLGGSA